MRAEITIQDGGCTVELTSNHNAPDFIMVVGKGADEQQALSDAMAQMPEKHIPPNDVLHITVIRVR